VQARSLDEFGEFPAFLDPVRQDQFLQGLGVERRFEMVHILVESLEPLVIAGKFPLELTVKFFPVTVDVDAMPGQHDLAGHLELTNDVELVIQDGKTAEDALEEPALEMRD